MDTKFIIIFFSALLPPSSYGTLKKRSSLPGDASHLAGRRFWLDVSAAAQADGSLLLAFAGTGAPVDASGLYRMDVGSPLPAGPEVCAVARADDSLAYFRCPTRS